MRLGKTKFEICLIGSVFGGPTDGIERADNIIFDIDELKFAGQVSGSFGTWRIQIQDSFDWPGP